ncbi:MAG: neutral/alkaline non-lysosomal ceramidase N-terminal domain-containing protein [Planctomycetaceae bacterium]|nr:neutral/alkaline non-lysosomal ceramidase N-terminal domain-containing protein [Planctomycetaceae bacterium]
MRLLSTVSLVICLLHAPIDTCADEMFEAGVGVIDITPVSGYRMSGYFSERLNTGTIDPLLAKAVVLRQGDTQAAIVFCDLIGISLDVSQRAREQAQEVTGIPAEHIAIAATHSHTGPMYFGALRQHFHDRLVAQKGLDPYEVTDYPTELAGRLVRAVMMAQENLKPVTLHAGYAQEDRLSFNRRFHMKSGPVRFNPGHLNPDIIRPAGPIDPEVGLISFTSEGTSSPQAAIVSFALHLDTLGGSLYSADYPRYVQEVLRESYGDEFVSLFGAGTCGDINHVDVTKPAPEGRRKTNEIGTMLGQTVAEALPQLNDVSQPSLAVARSVVEVDLQKYTAGEIEEARAMMDRVDDSGVPFLERVKAYSIMAAQLRGSDTIGLEVQAFRLSDDVAIVTLPGEVFVDLGLAIKQASPFETSLIVELTNDAPGYIPTRKAFAEGSYETVNSRVVPGSGEQMVDVAIELLNDLHATLP